MRRTISALFRTAGLLAMVGLLATLASAQFGSGIQGTVTDNTGSAVPGAAVTLTNTATNAKAQATTNDDGVYRFSNLPQGTYEIVVSQHESSGNNSDGPRR